MNKKRIFVGILLICFALCSVAVALFALLSGEEIAHTIHLTDIEATSRVMGVMRDASAIINIHRTEDRGVAPTPSGTATSYDMLVTPDGKTYLFVPITDREQYMEEFILYRAEADGWHPIGQAQATGDAHNASWLCDEDSNLYIITCLDADIQIHRYGHEGFTLLGRQKISDSEDDWCDALTALLDNNKIRIATTLTSNNPTEQSRELTFVDFSLKDMSFTTPIFSGSSIERLKYAATDESGDLYLFSVHNMPYMSSPSTWNRGLYMSRFRDGVLVEKILLTDIKENLTSFYLLPCEDRTYRLILQREMGHYRQLLLQGGKITPLDEIITEDSPFIFTGFFYQNALYGIGYRSDCTETVIAQFSEDSCEVVERFLTADMPFQHHAFNTTMLNVLSCLKTNNETVICLRFHASPSLSDPVETYLAQLIFK